MYNVWARQRLAGQAKVVKEGGGRGSSCLDRESAPTDGDGVCVKKHPKHQNGLDYPKLVGEASPSNAFSK